MRIYPERDTNTLSMKLPDDVDVTIYFYQGVPVMCSIIDYANPNIWLVNKPYNHKGFARYYISRTITEALKMSSIEVSYNTTAVFNKEMHRLMREYAACRNHKNWK